MRVLLTGATGLIGREVGKLLVANGHEVRVLSRDPRRAGRDLPFPAMAFEWDSESETFPSEALTGIEGVIHLAGEPIAEGRWTEDKKRKIRDSRVQGTRRLVQALLSRKETDGRTDLKAFVSGSAIGYYGDRDDETLTEASPKGEGFLADLVAEWEAQPDLLKAALGPAVRVAKVRTGVVFTRRGGALAKMLPVFTRGVGGKLASGQQWMSWIHIEDIARLFVFCLENPGAEGVFNGTAPEPARNDRFTVALSRAVGRPVFLPVPETALKLALGEMASALLGSQRVIPQRAQELGFEFRFPELVPALEDLGGPLKDGQHELVAEQWVPKSPEEVFPYFCNERNLEELTPPFLSFKVMGKSTDAIEEGTLIDYKLKLHGVPFSWRTKIEAWQPVKKFVDTQLKGPYRKWHHTHEFQPLGGGTLLRDRVLFKLPLGILGDTLGGWKVHKDVQQIFTFRRQKIRELFGAQP